MQDANQALIRRGHPTRMEINLHDRNSWTFELRFFFRTEAKAVQTIFNKTKNNNNEKT